MKVLDSGMSGGRKYQVAVLSAEEIKRSKYSWAKQGSLWAQQYEKDHPGQYVMTTRFQEKPAGRSTKPKDPDDKQPAQPKEEPGGKITQTTPNASPGVGAETPGFQEPGPSQPPPTKPPDVTAVPDTADVETPKSEEPQRGAAFQPPKTMTIGAESPAFAYAGLHIASSYSRQPEGTTRDAQNVRSYDPTSGRRRGSQRAGLSKFIAAQVVADEEIQDICHVVYSVS